MSILEKYIKVVDCVKCGRIASTVIMEPESQRGTEKLITLAKIANDHQTEMLRPVLKGNQIRLVTHTVCIGWKSKQINTEED